MIGSLLLLRIVTYHGDVVDHSNEEMFELLTQESMVSYIEIIEYDFNRIGSGVSPGQPAILSMDSVSISFRADVEGGMAAETVSYSLSDSTAAAGTENPGDVILYRTVNGAPTIDSPGGITDMVLRYYDVAGNQTGNPRDVRSIGVELTLESVHEYNGRYARAVWEKRITPENLLKSSMYNAP
jgi:hypothetical protein